MSEQGISKLRAWAGLCLMGFLGGASIGLMVGMLVTHLGWSMAALVLSGAVLFGVAYLDLMDHGFPWERR